MLVVATGERTEFARIATTIGSVPKTDFAGGIRRFGYLMTQIMLVIVILVFFANLLLARPTINLLLFSLAPAVGLTPAIIGVTLSRGSRTMAQGRGDRAPTRGDREPRQHGPPLHRQDRDADRRRDPARCLPRSGQPAEAIRRWALLNACLQTGLANPLDEVIAVARRPEDDRAGWAKTDEIPTTSFASGSRWWLREPGTSRDVMICKGVLGPIVGCCIAVATGPASGPSARRTRGQSTRGSAAGGSRASACSASCCAAPRIATDAAARTRPG